MAQMMSPPHDRLAAVRVALGRDKMWLLLRELVQPPPMSIIAGQSSSNLRHPTAIVRRLINFLKLGATLALDRAHKSLEILRGPIITCLHILLGTKQVPIQDVAHVGLPNALVLTTREFICCTAHVKV